MQLSGNRMDLDVCRMHSGRRACRAALTEGECLAGKARMRVRTTDTAANLVTGQTINYQPMWSV